MNQISALPNPLEILFQEYNQGRIESVGFPQLYPARW